MDLHESDYSLQEEEEQLMWHAIAVFDTEAHSARGRVPFAPYEAFFRRVRAIIGLRHHDVARIIQITPTPDDLEQLTTTPVLILRHEDFQEGDYRRAVLVDVEYHGATLLTSWKRTALSSNCRRSFTATTSLFGFVWTDFARQHNIDVWFGTKVSWSLNELRYLCCSNMETISG